MTAYDELIERYKEMTLMETVQAMIHWDMETYMPPRGIGLRSEQLGLLSRLSHRMSVDPEYGRCLDEAERASESLDEVGKRNLYLMRRTYDADTKLPEKLVGELSKQQAIATETWKKAKADNDWKMFEPELRKLMELSIEKAELLKGVKGAATVYDAMIDDFEPKMTADVITGIFSELRDGLVPMVERFADLTSRLDASFLSRPVPIETQRAICGDLCRVIEYDIASENAGGRIDEVEHPFCTGYYDDVRITVKYHEDKFDSAAFAILHEAGHALYEQNLNLEWKFQPVGVSSGMGIHESQSRFIENMIGRTPEFWEFYLPRLNELTGDLFSDVSLPDFCRAVNTVTPSKIRIEADEVTYSLHVIIRFEIERDLFNGKIDVSDLPAIWNEKYAEYLGVDIASDSEGVLQDTHWGSGLYGYFPSYALGNVFDGMWHEQMNEAMPGWTADLASGKIVEPIQWHTRNIHAASNLYDPEDLAKRVTGKALTAKPFLAYLEKKYNRLFT